MFLLQIYTFLPRFYPSPPPPAVCSCPVLALPAHGFPNILLTLLLILNALLCFCTNSCSLCLPVGRVGQCLLCKFILILPSPSSLHTGRLPSPHICPQADAAHLLPHSFCRQWGAAPVPAAPPHCICLCAL